MELRMPVGYPGAAVGGGDALDGQTFFALNAPQQRAMFAFWTAPGEFLIRVTHPAFVKWLVPAGIYFADPTAAGQSCAASHVLESLLLGACCLDPAIAGTAEDQFGDTFVTPNTLAAALDALVDAGLDLTLPVPLPADPSANLNILDARITALLGSNRAPNAIAIGDSQLIMCHTGGHEVPQLPDPGLDIGWTDFIRFSELTGFDGRLGPAGDLRALAGHFVLRAWRHNANGQYQIVLQTIAAHIWRNPAYMGLPWEVAPQLAAQFIVRTSWPGQLRLLYHAFPGVLEDVQLRFDYEVQTDAATKRIMLARLPSLLRAFVHVGALLGDVPPAEALGLAEHLVACTSDGASTTVSVGSFTALNAYLASRRAEVDRLRAEPAPLRVHAIEDAHRRATLDAAAAPMMLSPADGASADGTLGATKSAIGQTLTKPYRKDASLLLDSAAVAGPLVTRARQRGDPAGGGQVVDNTRSGLFALLNQPTVAGQPAEQLRLALALGNQILTQFIASTLHLDHPLFRLLAMARSSLAKMFSTAMVMTTAGGISNRDKTFDIDEYIPGFCQEIVEGKFDRNWWKVLEAITTHRKAPVAPVDKSEQWLQPRSTELAAIADSIVSTLGFVPSPAYSFLGFLSTCAQFTAAMPPELARDKIKAALMDMAMLRRTLRHRRQRRRNPTLPTVQRAMTKWIRLRGPPAERNIAPGLAGSGIDSAWASPSALSPGSAACTALAKRATQTAWRCTRLRAMRSQCPHPRLRQCARPTRAPTPHPRPQKSQPRTSFPDAWRRLKGRTSKAPCEGARPQPPIRPHTCQRHRPPHHRRRQRRRLWRHPPRRRRHRRTRLRRHRRRLRHCRTPVGRGPPRRAPASAAAPVPRQQLPPAPVPHLRGRKTRLLIARPRSAAVH